MKETYPQKLERLEHELALPEGKEIRREIAEMMPEQLLDQETRSVAVAEARKEVAETASVSDARDTLRQLKEAENRPRVANAGTVSREVREITKQRELIHLRRKLPVVQRGFSRLIHQPVVRVTSEAVGKTISRPSGLLGGGLIALMGTSGYLFMAKYLGFRYNYTVFISLFFGGFVFGVLLELAVHLATASRRQSD